MRLDIARELPAKPKAQPTAPAPDAGWTAPPPVPTLPLVPGRVEHLVGPGTDRGGARLVDRAHCRRLLGL